MEGLGQQLLTDLRDRQDRLEEEFHSSKWYPFATIAPIGDEHGKTSTRSRG